MSEVSGTRCNMSASTKKRRILVLMHEQNVPPATFDGLSPAEIDQVRTEDDVIEGLTELGHQVIPFGVGEDLSDLRKALDEHKPHLVFNLLEEFGGEVIHDYAVVAYLELRKVAYSGCNARGLLIARDKALSKKIVHYHRVRVPRFATVQRRKRIRRPASLTFPLIVKSLIHESSYGIAQASVVHDDEALAERVRFIHELTDDDAIVEQFVEGRELYASVVGNRRLQVLPTWELVLDDMPDGAVKIATRKVKWDRGYQAKHGIRITRARDLDDAIERRIASAARRICRTLSLDGYVRIDFRLTPDGKLYFLEANPNPQIADYDELASAAAAVGIDYNTLLQRVVSLGIRRRRG